MFDHVTIRASERDASERFYETALLTLGLDKGQSGEHYAEWEDFSVSQAHEDKPATRRLHVGFVAPGPRPEYGDDYYGGFLLDPDGDNIEVVNHNRPAS